MIRIKRVYDPPAKSDGERYLVDRIWPRGVNKEDAKLAGWLKDLAPSTGLRQWFHHDPAKWVEFQRRYREELKTPDKRTLLQDLAARAKPGTVTLVFAAADPEHNNAAALKRLIELRERG